MKKLLPFIFLVNLFLSCSEGELTVDIDLISFLHSTVINYQSQTFSAPEDLPLNEDLPKDTNLSFPARLAPIVVNLVEGGSDLTEINKTTLQLKMSIQPQNFSGTVELKLYIGIQGDIYNDPTAVQVSDKEILPGTFELTSSDSRLNLIFQQDEIFIGMEFVIEPTRLESHQISISGHVDDFKAVIKGSQGIF